MVLDDFLDTNIVVNYINCNEDSKKIVKASYDYVKNIKGEILLCGFVVLELKNLLKKKAIIHNVVLKKMNDGDYDLSESLSNRELSHAKKLYVVVKDRGIQEISEIFSKERMFFEIGIEKFLKFRLGEAVLSVNEIDQELVRKIHDLISNIDDCKVLASALQYRKAKKSNFNFVTADDDFDKNGYDYLKEHFEINYSEDKYEFPKLVNLLSN